MESLGDGVRRELRRFGSPGSIGELVEAWTEAVGPEIARNAWPARVQRDGTLVVHARDAVWAFELTQRAGEISSRLPGAPPVKLVPGPLPEPTPPVAGEAAELPAVTAEQAHAASEWAAAIEDVELRELVGRAAAASLARGTADRRV
jgi:hypothetical protein